jgi:hypothetical protein
VREIEAWLLADARPLRALLRNDASLGLPSDPESVIEPKRALREALAAGGAPALRRQEVYAFLGANVDTAALRHLAAFCRFEDQLTAAILAAARVA